MSTEIPDELKADLPQNKFGKVLGATPVVMAVIATMLAGLASSEMTRAQYDRAFAAQLQSKAGDQWSYFQAKKLRGSLAHNSQDMLEATSDARPLAAAALPVADAVAAAALTKNKLPEVAEVKFDGNVNAALAAVENYRPEPEIAAALAKVKEPVLAESLMAAKSAALAFDKATKPINQAVDTLTASMMTGDKNTFRDFTVNRLAYLAARYDTEARLNQTIASLYELQVRQSNYSAEKHHRRSGKFFYGMLGAQLAVIISTFAIAARQRSFLWSIAAAAGLAAIIFAAYVFIYV